MSLQKLPTGFGRLAASPPQIVAKDTLEATYTLTWEWPWEVNNGADTILGNLQAVAAGDTIRVVKLDGVNYVAVEASDYNLDIAFGMKVTVDQVN